MTDWECEYRALREGLEALADGLENHRASFDVDRDVALNGIQNRVRALLTPSPAEGTGEACEHPYRRVAQNTFGGPVVMECDRCGHEIPAPAPVSSGAAGEHEWWDLDHDRKADAYTPPERARCRRCGQGYNMHTFMDGTCRPAPVVTPSAEDGA